MLRGLGAFALLLCVLHIGAVRAAEPVVPVSEDSVAVALVPRAILIDPPGTLSPEQALVRLTGPDAAVESKVVSHGYIADILWARIVLDLAPEAAGRWYLSLELPNFDQLQVFRVPDPVVAPEPFVELGDRVRGPAEILSRFHIAPIDLPAGRTVLLVRGRTGSTMTLDLKLRKLDALVIEERSYFALQAFYLGIAAIFGASAIGLFAYSRQSVYLVYVVNLMAHTMLWLLINGTGPGYLWPTLARTLHLDPHPFVWLTVYGTGAFAAHFLATTRVPVLVCKALRAMAAVGLVMGVLTFFVPRDDIYWSHALVSTVALLILAVLFGLTGIGLYRGEPAARPLMLTWLGLVLAVVFALLRDIGVVPSNTFTLTGAQLGSVFEMLVFGYMLVTRLGRLQREKEQLQREALAAAREQEIVLERRVADRTAELDAAIVRERNARRLQQQFVAMISHEFRTPLAIIDGAAQNIGVQEPRNRGRVEKIRTAVRRLLRMIETCLIDERVEGGTIQLQAQTFDLRELLEEACDAVRAAAPDHVFAIRVPAEPVLVRADLRLTEIAVGNLLENAVKYSPAGSTVDVALGDLPDGVEIVVSDDGPGVPPADRERIFEKYQRGGGAAATTGAGLGLHLVRAILDAHGGSVHYRDGAARGGCFVVRLPTGQPQGRALAG